MKIKSIKLHNFMRYKGDNTLDFSTDDEKNVTIVLGDNTFGKTTLAQAFRWGLYETFNETNYTKKKDIVLLNNEVAAEMKEKSIEDVSVEIVVVNEKEEIKFVRKASFNRKNGNPDDISVKQLGNTKLTMQIRKENVWGEIISNDGDNVDKKKFKAGCVQETIDNMFPPSLSNYFFFDGERWNDLKSKKDDIKSSIDTILGVSGLLEMMNHLKGRSGVDKKLRGNVQGASGEYERLQHEIQGLEDTIIDYEKRILETNNAIITTQGIVDSTQKTINDNRKIEDDQKEYNRLEADIKRYEGFKEDYYADVVKAFSNSAKFFTASLLEKFVEKLNTIDLQGKDIPGVTVDTINYLFEHDECLCGSKLSENQIAYDNLMKLKSLVPPEMLGGAAGKLQNTLEEWKQDTADLVKDVLDKANNFDIAQDTLDDKTKDLEKLEKIIDRKTNLGPVRAQNKQARERLASLQNQKTTYELRKEQAIKNKEEKEKQLDAVAMHDKENRMIYRAMAYVDAMYEKAQFISEQRKHTTITDLNELIADNFQRMFNDKEKYAQLGNDYKVHVYYRQLGNLTNVEEEVLSNGETIAINFVFIVSILELANRYRDLEKADEEYGMENAILGLPLVLDGPFSALGSENISLISNRLPQFAEQVIIFMLDKDWEASGLEKYTLPEYCYRVSKEDTSNSSALEKNV